MSKRKAPAAVEVPAVPVPVESDEDDEAEAETAAETAAAAPKAAGAAKEDEVEANAWEKRRKARAAAAEAAALEAFIERHEREQSLLHTVFILYLNREDETCFEMLPIDEMPPLMYESILLFGIRPKIDVKTANDFQKACYCVYRSLLESLFPEPKEVIEALEEAYERVTKRNWQSLKKYVEHFQAKYSDFNCGFLSTDLKKSLFPNHDPKMVVIDHVLMFDY
jgi:hypothetical protein